MRKRQILAGIPAGTMLDAATFTDGDPFDLIAATGVSLPIIDLAPGERPNPYITKAVQVPGDTTAASFWDFSLPPGCRYAKVRCYARRRGTSSASVSTPVSGFRRAAGNDSILAVYGTGNAKIDQLSMQNGAGSAIPGQTPVLAPLNGWIRIEEEIRVGADGATGYSRVAWYLGDSTTAQFDYQRGDVAILVEDVTSHRWAKSNATGTLPWDFAGFEISDVDNGQLLGPYVPPSPSAIIVPSPATIELEARNPSVVSGSSETGGGPMAITVGMRAPAAVTGGGPASTPFTAAPPRVVVGTIGMRVPNVIGVSNPVAAPSIRGGDAALEPLAVGLGVATLSAMSVRPAQATIQSGG